MFWGEIHLGPWTHAKIVDKDHVCFVYCARKGAGLHHPMGLHTNIFRLRPKWLGFGARFEAFIDGRLCRVRPSTPERWVTGSVGECT